MESSSWVKAFTPDGEYVEIPSSFVDAAIVQGYKIATPEDRQRQLKKELIEDNNPVLSRVAATLVPAANTATFGALGAGLKNLAPDLAEVADLTQEAHPNYATAGTVAGFAGSMVPAGAIGKAGQVAKANVLGKTGSNILARTAQLGTEGAMMAAPKAIVEGFTGDPQEAVEEFVGSGLAMSVLGAVVGAGEVGVAKLKPFVNYLGKRMPEVAQNMELKALGTNQTLMGNLSEEARQNALRVAEERGYLGTLVTARQQRQMIRRDLAAVGGELEGVYKLIDKTPNVKSGISKEGYVLMLKTLKSKIPPGDPSNYLRRPIDKIIKYASKLEPGPNGQISFSDLHKMQYMTFADKAYTAAGGKKPGQLSKIWGEIRDVTQNILAQGVKSAEGSVAPGLYKKLLQARENYSGLKIIEQATKFRSKQAANRSIGLSDNIVTTAGGAVTQMATGNPLLAILGAVGALGANKLRYEFGDKVAARAIKESMVGAKALRQGMKASTDAIFSDALMPARKAAVGQVINALTGEKDPDLATKQLVARLNEATSSPEMLMEQVAEAMPQLSTLPPEISSGVNEKVFQVVQALRNAAPDIPQKDNPFADDPPPLSSQQIANYEGVIRAIIKPGSIVDDIARGSVDPNTLGAFKMLYPSLYDSVRMDILDRTAKKKGPIPYAKRLSLGMFYGKETDPLTAAPKVYSLQQNFKAEQDEPNKSRRKPTYGDDLKTTSDRMESR